MKKILWITVSLTAGLGLVSLFTGLTASGNALAAYQVQVGDTSDPEPFVDLSLKQGSDAPGEILATLDPAWTAPNSVSNYSLAWADIDLDGDLDLLAGNDGVNQMYENIGGPVTQILSQTFTFECDPGDDHTRSVNWGDFNHDGFPDLAVGNANGNDCIYQNINGSLALAWNDNAAHDTRSVAWAGWTANGVFNTYLAMGYAGEPNVVYRIIGGEPDGQPIWTDSLFNSTTSVTWGDFNNDGRPDLAVGNFGQNNFVYRNTGNSLTLSYTIPDNHKTRSLAWGDVNGDGYLDLAEANGESLGVSDPDYVYCNDGPPNYTFSQCWVSTDAVSAYSAAWGDFEGDGDIDLALSSEANGFTRVYQNIAGVLGTSPAWTANDEDDDSRAVAWADWNADGDMELAIGYYGTPSKVFENTVGTFRSTIVDPTTFDTRSIAWGDWDNDGDPDLAVGNSSFASNLIYENNDGILTQVFSTTEADNTRTLAWGDYDGDHDLDLVVGNGLSGGGQVNRLYENTGGALVLSPDFMINTPADTYSLAWGDYDGDQDLDIAAGNFGSGQPNRIYINRNGVFTQSVNIGPTGDQTLSIAWGDFDQDFDLDLLVGNNDGANRLLINDGSGSFSAVTLPEPDGSCSSAPGSDTWSIAWADWDGDGDLDIATGNAGSSGCFQIITSQNNGGTWEFTPAWQSPALDVRSIAWADFNGDGFPDLAIGISGTFGERNRIYRTDNGQMVMVWRAPTADADPTRTVAWADVDKDGDFDLATGNASAATRLYLNTISDESLLPNDPPVIRLMRPDSTGDASYFSTYEIMGQSVISIPFELFDDEGDNAFKVEFQVSWNGGAWEPACEYGEDCTAPTGVWEDVVTTVSGEPAAYEFVWNALYHLLAHQGLTLDHDSDTFLPFDESNEEMDVAFRIVVWSNPDHGGLILRPPFSHRTNMVRVDMRPDWSSAVKLNTPLYGTPGEVMDYAIVITQTDHGMPPAYILDPVPDFMTLYNGPASTTGYPTTNGDTITWTNFLPVNDLFPWGQLVTETTSIAFPDVFTLNFETLLHRPLTNGLMITNTALIFDGLHQPIYINNTFVISSSPTLTESWKLVNDQPENIAAPGEIMTYSIVLTNTGTENAYNVIMTDTLPGVVSWAGFVDSSSGTAFFSNGAITWLGDVRVFEPVTVAFSVQIDYPLVGTYFTNTFEIHHSSIITPFVSIPVTTTVLAPNFLPSYKTATTDTVELGDLLTYTLLITNVGLTDAFSVTLTDPMPGASGYVTNSFQASAGVGTYNPNTNSIEWSSPLIATYDPITMTFVVTVDLPYQPATPILSNTARLEDPVSGGYDLNHQAFVFLPNFNTSYKFGSTNQLQLGDLITYTIVIRNSGGRSPVTTLTDPILGGSEYISGSLTTTGGLGSYNPATNAIEWVGDMATGDVVTLTFMITAGVPITSPTNILVNDALVVDAVGFETHLVDTANITAPDLTSSSKIGTPELVELGDLVTYTIIVNNTGGNAPGIVFTDPFTDGLSYSPGSFTSTFGTGGYNPGTNAIIWIGDLGTGESAQLQFAAQVSCPITGTTVNNNALLVDPLGTETMISASTFVYMPDFSDSLLLSIPTKVQPGTLLTYQLVIRNTGGYAPFASMSTLPLTGQVYIDASATTGTTSYDSSTKVVSWTGSLSTGQEVFMTIQVQVTSAVGVSLTAQLNTGCATSDLEIHVPGAGIFLPLIYKP